jgi:hypothetical protein
VQLLQNVQVIDFVRLQGTRDSLSVPRFAKSNH